MRVYVYVEVNPEPWAVGTAAAGRRGGKIKASMSPNQKLQVYQNALRDEVNQVLDEMQSRPLPQVDDLRIRFWFWRQVETGHTPTGRTLTGNYADATNLQKATEDALQGLMYGNDRHTRRITSDIVEQGPEVTPGVAILVERYKVIQEPETSIATEMRMKHQMQQRQEGQGTPWG